MACASLEQPVDAVAVATALLARGANVEALDLLYGNTALAEAQNNHQTELAALLRAHGAR
jgi:hypothetical protein